MQVSCLYMNVCVYVCLYLCEFVCVSETAIFSKKHQGSYKTFIKNIMNGQTARVDNGYRRLVFTFGLI